MNKGPKSAPGIAALGYTLAKAIKRVCYREATVLDPHWDGGKRLFSFQQHQTRAREEKSGQMGGQVIQRLNLTPSCGGLQFRLGVSAQRGDMS